MTTTQTTPTGIDTDWTGITQPSITYPGTEAEAKADAFELQAIADHYDQATHGWTPGERLAAWLETKRILDHMRGLDGYTGRHRREDHDQGAA